MALEGVMRLSYADLAKYTDNFSASNYIGFFQYGKFYRGKILRGKSIQYVMVKIWEDSEYYRFWPGDNDSRLMDEITLLRHDKMVNLPGMVKLYGFCFKGQHLGAVYNFKPMDSIYNLIPKDGLTWKQRINVAIGVASLLEFLHSQITPGFKPFRIRNLDCAHIVLDEDYNPKLCDFGLITGGIFPDRSVYLAYYKQGSYGYEDLTACAYAPKYEDKKDVYAFGCILLSLISKRVFNSQEGWIDGVQTVAEWAIDEFMDFEYPDEGGKSRKQQISEKPKFSLVHSSLENDPDYDIDDACEVTSLGIECVEGSCHFRPTMATVLRSLLRLKVVKDHAHSLPVKKGKKDKKSRHVNKAKKNKKSSPPEKEAAPRMIK